LFKDKCFEFRVKLMPEKGNPSRSRISSSAVSDGGAYGRHSCLGREFRRSTGAWLVKDLSVILRRERPDGRWRVMMSDRSELNG